MRAYLIRLASRFLARAAKAGVYADACTPGMDPDARAVLMQVADGIFPEPVRSLTAAEATTILRQFDELREIAKRRWEDYRDAERRAGDFEDLVELQNIRRSLAAHPEVTHPYTSRERPVRYRWRGDVLELAPLNRDDWTPAIGVHAAELLALASLHGQQGGAS